MDFGSGTQIQHIIPCLFNEYSIIVPNFLLIFREAWPMPPSIACTVVTGSQGDDLSPALNSGWSRAVKDVVSRYVLRLQ